MESDIITMILNIPSNEQFYQFLHNAIDEKVGKTSTNLGNINNDVDWSEENQAVARKYFQNIFNNAAMDEEYKISEKLIELGSEKIKCVEDCFEVRKPEILQVLQNEILAKMEDPVVTGYDWKVKWIIGSSALSSIREPIVQVDLQSLKINQNESIKNTTKFEMNINELNTFITQIEKSLSNLKVS